MSFASWLQNLRSSISPDRMERKHRRRRSLRAAAHRPRLEVLEDRFAPANLLHSLFPDPTGPQQDAHFGTAVAADTNFLVVGAPTSYVGGIRDVGQAFVYNATTGALVVTLNNPTPAAFGDFGVSVAVSGNTVVVGAENSGDGSAYVFNASTGALVATLNDATPGSGNHFGSSVAVSGNTVVVGASADDTGTMVLVGLVYVFNASTGTLVATLNNPTPADYDDFGFSVAVTGNTVVVGAVGDDTGATNAGSAYVFNATTGALVATLNNPTPAINDFFGFSVAVSGNAVTVGALYDDTGATDSGSAYIFNATTGALVATLSNPTPASGDRFGISVAASGNAVVVGAAGDDTGATDSGSAYVFNAATGALVVTLNNPTPADSDYFGVSVAVSGNTAVVGADRDDTGATDAGSVYVLNAATGALVATLNNATPAAFDYFGNSVAASGNIVVVGADGDDLGATDDGSAYVFNAATGALIATLNNPTPVQNDFFGVSVAVSGNTVVVGALTDDTGATNAGSAYVFNATTGTLIATLNNPTPWDFDYFGYSVAVSGNTVVVGAYGDYGATGAGPVGSAYVFNAATGALIATLNNPTPEINDYFGYSVAVSGNTVVVGAFLDDTQAEDAGSAYVFNATTGALVATLNNPTPTSSDSFGVSVAVSSNTVVVGALGHQSAYVFNATTGAPVATLNNPTQVYADSFGSSVAVSGTTVVVGAFLGDTGAEDAGSAYVFNATTGALIDTLNNPTPAIGDEFGLSVAVSGATVVVGAPRDATQNSYQGAAYVYSLAAPTVQAVQVNDGSAQRSRVTSLTVTFSTTVTFAGTVANAFTLTRDGGASVNFAAAASIMGGVTVVMLDTFTGLETEFGSLTDGRYTLTALASQISANGQQMTSNYSFGNAQGLFRFFGDINGDQVVNGFDLSFLRSAFGTSAGDPNFLSYFDFNGDGVINGFDLGQFRTRFGTMLP